MKKAEYKKKQERTGPEMLPVYDEFFREYELYLTRPNGSKGRGKGFRRLKKNVIVDILLPRGMSMGVCKMSPIFIIKWISLSEFSRITGFAYEKVYHLYRDGKFKVAKDNDKPERSKKVIMIDLEDAIRAIYNLGFIEESDRAYTCSVCIRRYFISELKACLGDSLFGIVAK